ncbi:MAG: twin-arginine translocase TatA/TatE family subunit [Gemmatimonadales bacterium]|nr:twin-arginine translocase TatA/TatE family subunit [Gemmatimonadales bacterium]
MGNLGFTEIMIILVVVLLVFGAKRLPEIGASMGKGIREFKKSISDAGESVTQLPTEDRSTTPRNLDAPAQPQATTGEPKRLSQ